jgi:hypothetical protein
MRCKLNILRYLSAELPGPYQTKGPGFAIQSTKWQIVATICYSICPRPFSFESTPIVFPDDPYRPALTLYLRPVELLSSAP